MHELTKLLFEMQADLLYYPSILVRHSQRHIFYQLYLTRHSHQSICFINTRVLSIGNTLDLYCLQRTVSSLSNSLIINWFYQTFWVLNAIPIELSLLFASILLHVKMVQINHNALCYFAIYLICQLKRKRIKSKADIIHRFLSEDTRELLPIRSRTRLIYFHKEHQFQMEF